MAHWRPAFASVAAARRWRAFSLSHSSCPLSTARRDLPEPQRTSCRRWKRGRSLVAEHPEVRTVFVSGLAGGRGVVPTRGRTELATSMAGYRDAWRALPANVRRVVVLHDTPKTPPGTGACIERPWPAGGAPAWPARRRPTARSTPTRSPPPPAAASPPRRAPVPGA